MTFFASPTHPIPPPISAHAHTSRVYVPSTYLASYMSHMCVPIYRNGLKFSRVLKKEIVHRSTVAGKAWRSARNEKRFDSIHLYNFEGALSLLYATMMIVIFFLVASLSWDGWRPTRRRRGTVNGFVQIYKCDERQCSMNFTTPIYMYKPCIFRQRNTICWPKTVYAKTKMREKEIGPKFPLRSIYIRTK